MATKKEKKKELVNVLMEKKGLKKTSIITIVVLFTLTIIFVSSISKVSAFGISSEFWEQNPLKMYPGEEREITLDLQNMAGTEEISAKGSIIEGSEIAEIKNLDDEFLVPLGQRVPVKMKIEIPQEAQTGDSYNIKLSFITKPTGEAETLGFSSGIERNIPVSVVERAPVISESKEETPSPYIIMFSLIAVIVLIAIITLIIKKRPLSGKQKSR